MITISIEQAKLVLVCLGWHVSEQQGELRAKNDRCLAYPALAAPAHNPAWAWETLLRAALNVQAGLT